MAAFDPEHPWLVANHDKLRRLSQRQSATERAVWAASEAMTREDFDGAHWHASAAAESAVSCQAEAVSNLLSGIETALVQRRDARNAARRRSAAELLPCLIDLANEISGQSGATTPPRPIGGVPAAAGAPTIPDSCSFKYEYRVKWNLEPSCTCPGYTFDLSLHRCVKGTPSRR